MSVSENDLRRTITRLAEAVGGFHDSLYVQKHAFYFRKMSECCNFIKVRFWDELRAMLMSVDRMATVSTEIFPSYLPICLCPVPVSIRLWSALERPHSTYSRWDISSTWNATLWSDRGATGVSKERWGIKVSSTCAVAYLVEYNQHSPLSSLKRKREQLFGTST